MADAGNAAAGYRPIAASGEPDPGQGGTPHVTAGASPAVRRHSAGGSGPVFGLAQAGLAHRLHAPLARGGSAMTSDAAPWRRLLRAQARSLRMPSTPSADSHELTACSVRLLMATDLLINIPIRYEDARCFPHRRGAAPPPPPQPDRRARVARAMSDTRSVEERPICSSGRVHSHCHSRIEEHEHDRHA